jgi:hypothetical protein
MQQWVNALERMFVLLLRSPGSELEQGLLIGGAFLVMSWVMTRAGTAFGIPNTGVYYSVAVSAIGVALAVAALAALELYGPPLADASLRFWAQAGAVAAVSVVVVAPMIGLLQRGGYIAALLTWAISFGAAIGVILLVSAAFDGIRAGGRSADRTRSHREDVEAIQR